MSFTTAVKTCFRKYVTFSGRATRSEFWWFYLFTVIIATVVNVVVFSVAFGAAVASDDGTVGAGAGALGGVLSLLAGLVSLGLVIPFLAVAWRRLHDTDRSGLFYLLALIPLVGLIVLIVFWVQDSTPGTNRFGPSPRDASSLGAPGLGTPQPGYGAAQPGYGEPQR